jgi:hypothetical protein
MPDRTQYCNIAIPRLAARSGCLQQQKSKPQVVNRENPPVHSVQQAVFFTMALACSRGNNNLMRAGLFCAGRS